MSDLRIYSVSDRYIEFLRDDVRLKNVFDSKVDLRKHTRKYLGVALRVNGYDYFIPFSSPKANDYEIKNGEKKIKKNIPTIMRIVVVNSKTGESELKGTLKIGNMIPVPESELMLYDINSEPDSKYRDLVTKEYEFIRKNTDKILKNASVVYKQRVYREKIFSNRQEPNYLNFTVDFQFAEERCEEFTLNHQQDIDFDENVYQTTELEESETDYQDQDFDFVQSM